MAAEKESPYACHIFVCVNDRQGRRKSCADGHNPAIRLTLKAEIAQRGWPPEVRVSPCGCMGLCADGPNVMLYPQKIWFSQVSEDDAAAILAAVDGIVKSVSTN